MPEAKMKKYAVTLQRKVKNILSTMTLFIEASHRRKAIFVAEQVINRSHVADKEYHFVWKTQKVEVVENESDIPNDIDVE
jgi:hypothetical protein